MPEYKIIYNSESSHWYRSDGRNRLLIETVCELVNSELRERGYVYAKEIYDILDVRWNDEQEDTCYKIDEHNSIELLIREVDPYVYEITLRAHRIN